MSDKEFSPATAQDKLILKKMRFRRIIDINMVRVFFFVLIVSMIISLIPMLRPDYSETEKRKLTEFPKITFKTFLNGEFFDGINLWFSDTFPFRDTFVKINGFMQGTFGHSEVEIHGEVQKGDDIPEVPEKSEAPAESEPAEVAPVEPPPAPEPQYAVEQLGAIMLVDNAAYEYYNFSQQQADLYSAYISRAADMLGAEYNVYDIIVPTSMGVCAPDSIVSGINTSDQKKAIDYIYGKMSQNVKSVNIYDALKSKKDEYYYFRTDHHWTARGAYVAYSELMKKKGAAAAPLDAFECLRFEGFLGSFYAQSGKSPKLAETPDYVEAFRPRQTNTITTVMPAGNQADLQIVSDGNTLGPSNKYLCFIGGDKPFASITNPEITDGSACIVIKESFGNAFVPFLTQNYQTVYVVDYRIFSNVDARKLAQLSADTGAKDIIFINNVSATRSKSLVAAIGAFVG